MATKALTTRRTSCDTRQERRQINLVFTGQSPSLRALEEAERITGLSPTRIVRSLIESHLPEWLQEEVERRRQLEEAAARRADAVDMGLRVQRLGRQRPRYRGESTLPPDYADAVAMRVPLVPRVITTCKDIQVKRVSSRPRSQLLPVAPVEDDDAESV